MEVLDILFNDITKPSSKNYSCTDFQKFLQIRSSTTNLRKMQTLNTPLIYHNAASSKNNLTRRADACHEEGHWHWAQSMNFSIGKATSNQQIH